MRSRKGAQAVIDAIPARIVADCDALLDVLSAIEARLDAEQTTDAGGENAAAAAA